MSAQERVVGEAEVHTQADEKASKCWKTEAEDVSISRDNGVPADQEKAPEGERGAQVNERTKKNLKIVGARCPSLIGAAATKSLRAQRRDSVVHLYRQLPREVVECRMPCF